jgi:hypothetical protein
VNGEIIISRVGVVNGDGNSLSVEIARDESSMSKVNE